MAFWSERFRRPDEDDIWEELKYWLQNPVTETELALRDKEKQEYINSIMDLAFPAESLTKNKKPYLNYEELIDNSSKKSDNLGGKTDNTRKLIQYSKEIEYNPNLTEEEKVAKKLEVAQILKGSQANLKDIEKEHIKKQAKNYAGAALQIGSAAIPGIAGGKIASGAIKAANPLINQIRNKMVAKGIAEGAISGSVEGLGRGLLENENPMKTSIQDSIIGALGGVASGKIAGEIIANKPKIKELDELLDKRRDWGIAYTKQSGKPDEAVEKLLEQKKGFVPKAIHKEGIGDIDFVWGKHLPAKNKNKKSSGEGLKHIIERRNEQDYNGIDFVKEIPESIKDGNIYIKPDHKGRIYIGNSVKENTIRTDYDKKPRNWLLTSYYKNKSTPSQDLAGCRTLDQTYANKQSFPLSDLSRSNNILTDISSDLNPQAVSPSIQAPKSYQEWLDELRRKCKPRGLF